MASEISAEAVATKIIEVRGKRVMLDRDLAKLYGVSTKRLNEQVRRNIKRFPSDFMYQLTMQEVTILRSQFATSRWGGRRYLPYVFTQEGVAMLSSVLNNERAIQVNIQIMRAFVKLKELLLSHKDLAIKIEELERRYADHDVKIRVIFDAIKQLLEHPKLKPESEPPKPEEPKRRIGFYKDQASQI
ncbi:MAG: ORF6N domain-containing protein [Candidatus Omnitrophica bacterium]|nr:ORF6N domain-containing protein [Candidatus Omnitrophota bacterium]